MSIFCLHKNTHLSQIHLTIDVGWCFNAVAVARAQFATQFRSFVYIHFSMGESNECMTCIYKFLFLLLHSWRFLFLLVLLWIISIVLCHFILSSCKRISHVVHLFREHFFSPSALRAISSKIVSPSVILFWNFITVPVQMKCNKSVCAYWEPEYIWCCKFSSQFWYNLKFGLHFALLKIS